MPYIITTTRNDRGPWGEDFANVLTRTAVATLDEARDFVGRYTDDDALWNEWCRDLPDVGGTIGPLPDGTVIEVKPVTLAELAGSPVANYNPAHTADVIAVFNERQGA